MMNHPNDRDPIPFTDPEESFDPRLVELLESLRPTPARNPDQVQSSRVRFMAELEAWQPTSTPSKSFLNRLTAWLPFTHPDTIPSKEEANMYNPKTRFAFTALTALVIALVFVFGGAGMTALAARSALPGDALYSVKTTLEQTQVALASDAANQAELHLAFAERRLDEISALIAEQRFDNIETATQEFEAYVNRAIAALQTVAAGDPERAHLLAGEISAALSRYATTLSGMMNSVPATVRQQMQRALVVSSASGDLDPADGDFEFNGVVESMGPDFWFVGGRTIAISTMTEIKGAVEVGDLVKVHAIRNADGTFQAREVETVLASDDDSNANGNDNSNDNSNDNGNFNANDNSTNDNSANDNVSNDNSANDNGSNDNGSNDNSNNDNDSNDNDSNDNGSNDNGSNDNDRNDNGSNDNGSNDNGGNDNGSDDHSGNSGSGGGNSGSGSNDNDD
jgi:uncharacterized membrane protein YgcG